MSYIDWRHLPRSEKPSSLSRASMFDVMLACFAGVLSFVLLGMLAAFATNAEPPVTTGIVILGP